MIKKILIILILISSFLYPQQSKNNLDSLFNLYVQIKQGTEQFRDNLEPAKSKCGFDIVNRVRTNFYNFNPEQQKILLTLFDRIPRAKSIISPSGFFRIHYNDAGTEVPRYVPSLTTDQNVMLIAEALDSSFNYEVNYLGYPYPRDNGGGGDNRYDIYIINTGGSGFYGYTEFETEVSPGSGTFTSFMVIDDDYAGFYSSGINGARVTIAHELHHGIQAGNYVYRESDIFYFEASSTAMEEFVYDTVNDYYAYMASYFNFPDIALTQQDGYNLAILNIFLEKKFDHSLLKRIWELMSADPALLAMNRALIERGSSFELEYHEFGVWTFFTKQRALPDKYFEEGQNYPLIKPLHVIQFTSPDEIIAGTSKPTGNNFIYFLEGADTLAAMITNTNIQTALSTPLANLTYNYELYDYVASGSTRLTDTYYMKFSSGTPHWQTTEIFNSLIVKGGIGSPILADFPFPSPFHYNQSYLTGSYIFIPVGQNNTGVAELSVFTISMDLVYNSVEQVISNINRNIIYAVRWDALNNNKQKLSTGVYIYVIKSGDEVTKGKMMIFND